MLLASGYMVPKKKKNHVKKKSSEHITAAALLVSTVYSEKHETSKFDVEVGGNRLSPAAINKQTRRASTPRKKVNHISRILATSSQQPLNRNKLEVKISERPQMETKIVHCTSKTLWMQQYNGQKQCFPFFFLKKKRQKMDFQALGDPSVLSSGPLIHDCNPTTLFDMCHVCTNTCTLTGCNVDPVFFSVYIKDI